MTGHIVIKRKVTKEKNNLQLLERKRKVTFKRKYKKNYRFILGNLQINDIDIPLDGRDKKLSMIQE